MALSLLKSRKFWAAVAGLVMIVVKAAWPQLPLTEEQLTGALAILGAYIVSVAIEDHGAKSGATVTITGGPEEPPAAQ